VKSVFVNIISAKKLLSANDESTEDTISAALALVAGMSILGRTFGHKEKIAWLEEDIGCWRLAICY